MPPKSQDFIARLLIRRIALHRHPPTVQKRKAGATARYCEQLLLPHIEFLWKSMERVSARRMGAAFKDWLPYYHQNGVSSNIKFLLQRMSVSTLDRFLSKASQEISGSAEGINLHFSGQLYEKQSTH